MRLAQHGKQRMQPGQRCLATEQPECHLIRPAAVPAILIWALSFPYKNHAKSGFYGKLKLNCKKALTRLNTTHIWPLTDAALPVYGLATNATVANRNGQPAPG